jgi:hypothetical protein
MLAVFLKTSSAEVLQTGPGPYMLPKNSTSDNLGSSRSERAKSVHLQLKMQSW